MEGEAVLFFSAGNALEHQHQGAARAANVDGLVGGVEHQHRHLQHVNRLHGGVIPGICSAAALAMDFCLRA
jgi:hypothetical protein